MQSECSGRLPTRVASVARNPTHDGREGHRQAPCPHSVACPAVFFSQKTRSIC